MLRKYAALYYERRRSKGITQVEADEIARQPLYFASLMVAAGDADGSVGGAVNSTAETVRAALHCVGADPRARLVSSVFIMALQDRSLGHNGLMAFADCAVVIDPTAMQLADIAIATAESTRVLIGAEPVVALLSFSTKGSGKHPEVDKVVEALQHRPGARAGAERGWRVAGRCGGFRSWWPESKAPGSKVAGRANTLVFPNLAVGQHRIQAGGAAGRRDGHRTVPAGAGQAGQRSLARLLGGRYLQRGGGDRAAVGDGVALCFRSAWSITKTTTCTSATTSSPRRSTSGCTIACSARASPRPEDFVAPEPATRRRYPAGARSRNG